MAGGAQRDPLSVRYDGTVRQALLRAIKAGRYRHSITIWIASPREEFRRKDKGGRTAHERAFTRSAYYQVVKVPYNAGVPQDYSLKLRWGEELEPSSRGRLARPVAVRMYRRSSGEGYVREKVARPWSEDVDGTGSWRKGTRRSVIGDRVDTREAG
jgi:hypothetical protein